jgi:uncharacterized damage-inducible protein DinB
MSCPETENFVSNWNRIHKQTSRALKAATDDKLDWQPQEGMFTLRELIRHIPEAENAIARTALAGLMQNSQVDLSKSSVAEIVETFDREHEQLASEISKLTLDQLNEEIEAFGRKMRRVVLLWALTEHEIHHRGQLYTYYHLAGIKPPDLYAT